MASAPVQIEVYSPSDKHLCFVFVQAPDNQFLELATKYPPEAFAGQNIKLNEAIKEGITQKETEGIARHLKIPHDTKLKFEVFRGIPEAVDHAMPPFDMNGKKFWILPQQS
jgi:hypothetical protein